MENPNKKNKIILFIVIILILAGAAAFYFLYFKKGNEIAVVPSSNDNPVTFTIGNQDVDISGNGNTNGNGQPIVKQDENTFITGSGNIPKLHKITKNPVAGATAITTTINKKDETKVRYIERATGHVYETPINSWVLKRLTNTTIPKVYEALFADAGNSILIRKITEDTEEIETYYAKLKPATTTKPVATNGEESPVIKETEMKIEGVYLPRNIDQIVVDPAGKKLFYLTQRNDRGVGFVSELNGTKPAQVFDSPLSDFLVTWPKADTLTFTTKPASSEDGFFYFGSSVNVNLKKILGGIGGLSTLTSPDAKFLLYGESTGIGYTLRLFDTVKKISSGVPLSTLPEKCLWSKLNMAVFYCAVPKTLPQASYPESWYQGLVSFNDEIWRLNIESGENKLLAKPTELAGEEIDAIKLFLSDDEDYLFFINKKNSSLWSLRLSENTATSTRPTE